MIREVDIEAMERIIVNHAGPVGPFVIKKALADLGGNPMNFDDAMKNKFIDMVLTRSIFDNSKRDEVRKQILEAWNHVI